MEGTEDGGPGKARREVGDVGQVREECGWAVESSSVFLMAGRRSVMYDTSMEYGNQ